MPSTSPPAMAPRKRPILTALLAIVAVTSQLLIISRGGSFHRNLDYDDDDDAAFAQMWSSSSSSGRRNERELALMDLLGLSSPAVEEGDQDEEDSEYGYSVLLVSYHKTGHDLQMDLVDYVTTEFPGVGPNVTSFGNKSPVRRRRHKANVPCARIHLLSGTISVQHAPDLFCSPEELARLLLDGRADGLPRKDGGVYETPERGVKIVHLVRNPFSMAVSNYHYHARKPTPEPWVKFQNPCDILYAGDASAPSYADMVLPTLSKMRYESMDGISFGGDPLVSRSEFDGIVNDCLSLYRTRPEMQSASFLDHLMNYDAPEGIRLATAEMTIQGYDNGGDILRMANNIVKFKQAQMMVRHSDEFQREGVVVEAGKAAKKKELHVYTMSLDDFIEKPAMSALKFFEFVLGRHNPRVSHMHKEAVAMKYEQHYLEKTERSRHVTQGKSENSEQLKEYLRHNPAFGPPLSKIEMLVETALEEGRNSRMLWP